MTISTITISAVDYIAYASVVEADAYLAVDPVRKATWEALTADQKGMNLVSATRRLDLLTWQGVKTGGSAQENQWPRTGITLKDGTAQSTTEVPLEVGNATILLAGSIAIKAAVAEQGTSGSNIKRVKAGSAEVQFFRQQEGKPLQDETAYQLVICFLEASSLSADLGPLATGTDGESSFTCIDNWGLTKGYS